MLMRMFLVEIVVRWEGAFQLGMFMLGLFGVDENVFGGTLGCLW